MEKMYVCLIFIFDCTVDCTYFYFNHKLYSVSVYDKPLN